MIDLDDFANFKRVDSENMLGEIDGLPNQLEAAWGLSQRLPVPAMKNISRVLIAGMGGSAIGADLLVAYAAPHCPVPIVVHRDYGLPAWARGPETLVVASSHSGNTEETLAAFEQAIVNDCSLMVISTGGKLVELAKTKGIPSWVFEHRGQPRAAVGYSFGLLLGLFSGLEFLPDPEADLKNALEAVRKQQASLMGDVPAVQNPAKRQAGQLIGRWVTVIGAEILAPVARRWKGQTSEIAKAWGQFEFLPEADHNTLAGTIHPEALSGSAITLFLMAPSYHPRNMLRSELTRKAFMLEGISADSYLAQGDGRLAHQWTTLHFGDYMAYYLAMAYGVDPTPVEMIEQFKVEMRTA